MHCIGDNHLKGIAAFVHDEEYKIVDRYITKGKPRAAGFGVSSDVRCDSPEKVILVMLIFAVLYD